MLDLSRDRLRTVTLATLRGTALGAAGIIGIVIWATVLFSLTRSFVPGSFSPTIRTVLATVADGLGTATVVVLYLRTSDQGFEFLDIQRPGVREAGYVIGGIAAILGVNFGVGFAFQYLGLERTSHTLIRTAQTNPEILLVLIPLSYVVVGPGEELLYRNVIQKSLCDVFSRWGAILIASGIFAGVHIFAYSSSSGSLVATGNTLLMIFLLAFVLGTIYDRTGNIMVPTLVHGTFNAIAFAASYVQITKITLGISIVDLSHDLSEPFIAVILPVC